MALVVNGKALCAMYILALLTLPHSADMSALLCRVRPTQDPLAVPPSLPHVWARRADRDPPPRLPGSRAKPKNSVLASGALNRSKVTEGTRYSLPLSTVHGDCWNHAKGAGKRTTVSRYSHLLNVFKEGTLLDSCKVPDDNLAWHND